MARHAQITQNKKFTISLQHFMKQVSDIVDFLHASKHEILLRNDTKTFGIGRMQCHCNI